MAGLPMLTRGRVAGEADISIYAEYDILDREFGYRIVNDLNDLLGELLHEAVPVFLRLAEFRVVYCRPPLSAQVLWLDNDKPRVFRCFKIPKHCFVELITMNFKALIC